MNFQTKIPLEKQDINLIDYNSKVLLMGSCFVENIGKKLSYFKFQNTINPFGILFHPKAIETTIVNAISKKVFDKEDVFFHHEQWHSFDAHSKLSSSLKGDIIEDLNNANSLTNKALEQSTHIVITLGTAWVYHHLKANRTVVNCHKIPQKAFDKNLLTVDAIITSLQKCISKIQEVNPETAVIFTVSPVRHLKDGFEENTLSKAHLIAAIQQVVANQKQVYYFPSFEIMMDDLRDYRFYKADMLHPNEVAVNYIWEKFKKVWMALNTESIMTKVDTVQKGLLHEPFNPNSKAHLKFLKQLKEEQNNLQSQFSHIIF